MKEGNQIHATITSKDTGDRLSAGAPLRFTEGGELSQHSVHLDARVKYQEMEGFGAAFTEAAAVTFRKMSSERQSEILTAYFDPDAGHGYSLCRTHINSCDFALGNYAYTETEDDTALKDFTIERDRQALIPMIRQGQEVSRRSFRLFASPWSPPAWMKTTGKMNNGGKLKPEYRDAWARYYCRYIKEYEREGIPIWGLTVQNEPEATQAWDSCIWTAEEERDFVRDHLGPQLEKNGLGHVKIIIWDHNRDRLFDRGKVVLEDPRAARYVWGTGFHWYVGDCYGNLQALHDLFPNKKLLFTEGCQTGGPHLGSWDLGERYAHSMINDLNNWTVGWVDWNMILDETGGPNHVGNFCSAPIIADTRTDELLYQSSYYYLGHFARFIKPGARRILCTTTMDELEATAFLNAGGKIVVVVLNRSERNLRFDLKFEGKAAKTAIPARSILTFRFGSG